MMEITKERLMRIGFAVSLAAQSICAHGSGKWQRLKAATPFYLAEFRILGLEFGKGLIHGAASHIYAYGSSGWFCDAIRGAARCAWLRNSKYKALYSI